MSDNLYLFANNNGGQAENNGSYRLYDMKIEGDSEGLESGVDYVDYLQSDGDSWIDTGVSIITGYKVEVKLERLKNTTRNTAIPICGVGTPTWYSYGLDYADFGLGLQYANILTKDESGGYTTTFKNLAINELLTIEYTAKNVQSKHSLPLFTHGVTIGAYYVDGNLGDYARIYSFKIWDTQNNLLIHLRPCLDTQGVPCMYDEVTKKYFYNKGTGTFKYKKTLREFQPVLDSNNIPCLLDKTNKKYYYNKGTGIFDTKEKPKYKKLKYIQGDGNSWITTNFTVSSTQGYDMEVKCEGIGNTMIFGKCAKGDISNSNLIYGLGYRGELGLSLYGSCDSHTHEGLVHTLTNLNTSNDLDTKLNLFGFGNYIGTSKIYYAKLYDENDNLVFNAIPILDENNTPCMYDLVSEQFFYNQGTGTFGYEVEELDAPQVDYVEYIEGDGKSYIDIPNMVYSDNMMFKFKCSIQQSSFLFGTNGTYNVGRTEIELNYKSMEILIFGSGGISYEYKLESNKLQEFQISPDGVVVNGSKSTTTFDFNWNNYTYAPNIFRLFGRYGYEEKISSVGTRIYEFKIFNENVLKFDLRPCLDEEGVPCMYDEVSKKYFYNQGTGTFGYGERTGYTEIEYIESTGTQYIDTEVVTTDNTDIDMTCRACDYNDNPTVNNSYILNGLVINDNKYNYKDTDTTVQPNLVASSGATLTMGTTNMNQLSDDDIEVATNNGWSIV